MTHHAMLPKGCLIHLRWLGVLSLVGCGLFESSYRTYPKSADRASNRKELVCAIDLAAFSTYMTPMLKERCTTGCHVAGGTADRHLVFTGQAENDAITLKKQEDGTANGLFRKSAGIVAHGGGKAALEKDRERFEKWFAASKLCPTPTGHTEEINRERGSR
jgi:hypothetical protein